jgi:hypothetical protein
MCFYDNINYQFESFENDNNCSFNNQLFAIETKIIKIYNKGNGYSKFVKHLDNIFAKYFETNPTMSNIYIENINVLKKGIISAYNNSKCINYFDDIIKFQTFNIND